MNESADKDGDMKAISERHLDPERIAALIDGRLGEAERKALIEALGNSEADTDVFMDAAAAVQAIGEAPAAIQPVAPRTVSRFRRRAWVPAGIAIAAAAAVVITLRGRPPGSEASRDFEGPQAFALTLSRNAALPAEWNYSPWSARRGSGIATADSVIYLRLGVRITDLEVARRANDTTAAALAGEIAAMLENVPGGGVAGAFYRLMAVPANTGDAELASRAGAALRGLPNQRLMERGAWVEGARIAAARGDLEWFRKPANERRLADLADRKESSPTIRAMAGEIRVELRKPSPNWKSVEDRLISILAEW